MIGKGNWFACFSDWCRDYYYPLEMTTEEAVKNIYPTLAERNFGITACHLVDDYTVSRNIARFGLKHKIIPEIDYTGLQQNLLAHQYLMDIDEKVLYIEKTMTAWGL